MCVGEACVAYRLVPHDAGWEEAICVYFDVALGPSLQPRLDDLKELELKDIEG
jgi:hypothetical protein